MYVNYGDKNFFERGRLVDNEKSEFEYYILCCEPYPNEEDLFQFGDCVVDLRDSWIDKEGVMNYLGMDQENFDPLQFALGCLDYYSWDNFGAISYSYDWTHMNKESVCEILKHKMIAADNLEIVW